MNKLTNSLFDKIGIFFDKKKAHNVRENGEKSSRVCTENIIIKSKQDVPGIDIFITSNTKNEEVFIPVVVSSEGLDDLVYNDFYIEDGAEATIYAGCVIHNNCENSSSHEGIHTFHIGKNAKIKYVEKHYGSGKNENKNINTKTIINIDENSSFEMDTVQIEGVNNALRETIARISNNGNLIVNEKIMTSNSDKVKTDFNILLDGINSATNIISRAIAKDNSKQEFISEINGNNKCFGHVECDAILIDNATVISTPKIVAKISDANLTHEAAIGKIAKDQVIKLMTFGLNEKEAEETIIKGFLN